MNILLAFLAFNVIVIIHELGHFITAKKAGIKVLEFSLFIGPKLFGFKRGDTEYSLRAIPAMAYVKMEGEEEDSSSVTAFNNKSVGARALTIFSGPLANIILALVLLTFVYSLQGMATCKAAEIYSNSPAAEAGMQSGDRLLKYDGKRVYTTIDVVQFLYVSKGKPAQIEYMSTEGKKTALLTPVIYPASTSYRMGAVFASSDGQYDDLIESVTPGYPAEEAGITAGDRVVSVDGREVSGRDQVVEILEKTEGKPVQIIVERNGSPVEMVLTPKKVETEEQYDIGLRFSIEKGNVIDAVGQAFTYAYSISRSVGYSVVWLVTGQVKMDQMMGPVGMVSSIGNVVSQVPGLMDKLISLFEMTALISIAVGVTNLVPFPMLDGNKLLLLGIEAIRRKPIKPEREAAISMIGFALLIAFALYATFNDLVRLIAG